MINIKIMCVGKIKEKSLSSLLSEYEKRISKYAKIDIIEVQDEKFDKKISHFTGFTAVFFYCKCQTPGCCIWENTCSFPKESPYIFLNPFETVAK